MINCRAEVGCCANLEATPDAGTAGHAELHAILVSVEKWLPRAVNTCGIGAEVNAGLGAEGTG